MDEPTTIEKPFACLQQGKERVKGELKILREKPLLSQPGLLFGASRMKKLSPCQIWTRDDAAEPGQKVLTQRGS
jgi:hypothetical protein